MKIAIVAPEFPPAVGGMEEYGAQVARGLLDRGHEVVTFTRKGNVGRGEGYEVVDLLEGRQFVDSHLLSALREFDIVHVMNAAWCWVAKSGAPTFLTVHGNDFLVPNPVFGFDLKPRFGLWFGDRIDHWLAIKRTRSMLNDCLCSCRTIFTNSAYTKQAFVRRFPKCSVPVVNAGLGVNPRFLNEDFGRLSSGSHRRLLTVCRLSEPRKNVDLVLRALAGLKDEFDFDYTIVGDGYLRHDLERLCIELDISERVTFAGKVAIAQLIKYYQLADLFVLVAGVSPQSFEGFGIVYLEANALGLPTLALRAAGAQEAVDEGRSGFFVEEASVDSIRRSLRCFLSGQARFRPEECRAFAKQFSWPQIIARFEKAYAEAQILSREAHFGETAEDSD